MSIAALLHRRGFPALIFGLVSFGWRWWAFSGSEYAPGWDGYFYLVQVKSLVEEGAMHSPDSSPIYLILRGLYFLCGNYVASFQLLCALMAGLFSGLSYWVAQRISGSAVTALVVAAWTLFSPSLTFFAAQFPKNLLGMNALLLLLGFSLRRATLPKIVALVLAFWSHRMTAGLSLFFAGTMRVSLRGLLGLLALLGAGVVLALAFPGLLRPADLERFSGAFQVMPQLQGLAFIQLLEPGRMHLAWIAEIGIAHLFLLYWLGTWIAQRPDHFGMAFFALLAMLVFPFFRMDLQGMGYRFFLSFMLLAPLIFAMIPHVLPPFFFRLGAMVFLAGSLWSAQAYSPERFDPDYGYFEHVADRAAAKLEGKAPELLIGHKGLAELMTFKTGIDVLPWQPEYEVDSAALWRIAAEVSPMEYRYFLGAHDKARVMELSLDYALLPETVWQRFVQAAENDGDEDLLERIGSWRNPGEERPDWLKK